jgi:hypothetical protein
MQLPRLRYFETMFAEFARPGLKKGGHISATQSYSRTALNAQTNCRAKLEPKTYEW